MKQIEVDYISLGLNFIELVESLTWIFLLYQCTVEIEIVSLLGINLYPSDNIPSYALYRLS